MSLRPTLIALLTGLLAPLLNLPARAQVFGFPGYYRPPIRHIPGRYGPGMSFGEFGYRLNYGYAFGNPYGGLGSIGYGFGSGIGPGYGRGGSIIYSSAYITPGAGTGINGYYPPWAAYGYSNQNPAIFGPGAPNWPRTYVPQPASRVPARRPW